MYGGPNEMGIATLCAAEIFALADGQSILLYVRILFNFKNFVSDQPRIRYSVGDRAVEWDYTVTASYSGYVIGSTPC